MFENKTGEYYTLDLGVFEVVKAERGSNAGQDPIVNESGNVAVGRKYAGKSVKVFVRIEGV